MPSLPLQNMPALVPELLVTDLAQSLDFYLHSLEFRIEYERPENNFALLSLCGAWLMLEQTDSLAAVSDDEFVYSREWRTAELHHPFGRGVNLQIVVDEIERRYRSFADKGFKVRLPLEERAYRVGVSYVRVRQFMVQDPDGYLLRLQQRVDGDSTTSR